ncbi:MAG: hypothetical protein ABI729_06290 [Chitinophagales bacterium]
MNGVDQMFIVDSLKIKSLNFSNEVPDYSFNSFGFGATLIDSSYHPSIWSLSNDNKEIAIGNLGCYGEDPAPFAPLPGFLIETCNPGLDWEVLKLSENKMWLRINYQDNEYEVHLKEL